MMDVLIGWPGGGWQASARLFSGLLGAYLLLLWLASILWVYRDIRERSDDPVTHIVGVAIAVIFPIVGLPIYMILRPGETLNAAYESQLERDALLSELHSINACPNCRRPTHEDFTVCAFCGTTLRQPCAQCGQPLQPAWRHCPYCAALQPHAQAREVRRTITEEPLAGARASGRAGALDAIRRAAMRSSTADREGEPPRRARQAEEPTTGMTPPRPRPRSRMSPEDDDR